MENQNNQVVNTADWFLTIFISGIPIIGIVMLFVWAFGQGTNPNKVNWAKATLLWMAIGIVIAVIIIAVFGVVFAKIFSHLYQS